MIDPNQGGYAKSVAHVAHKLDMPSWFVDLRHAGTHEHLPSLQVLRKGCQQVNNKSSRRIRDCITSHILVYFNLKFNQALKWLEDKYWTAQNSAISTISTLIDEIRSIIIDYKKRSRGS